MRRLAIRAAIVTSTVSTLVLAGFAACAPTHSSGPSAQPPSEPAPVADANPSTMRNLTGSEWVVTHIDANPVPAPSAAGRGPWMKFETQDGAPRVTGVGGCNNFSGSYTTSGARDLEFGPLMATKMACANLGVEDAFFAALEAVRHWNVVGNRLELTDAAGKVLVRLEAKS